MKCVRCGNDRYYANQVCRHEVTTDEYGNFEENDTRNYADGIYEADIPYGPFICTKCGAGYRTLKEGQKPMKDEEL